MKKFNIAIDGPSASGKSTIAKALADTYHLIHIDTGAMYRCVGYYAMTNDLDVNNEIAMVIATKECQIEFQNEKVFLNTEDVTEAIRTEEISWLASVLSTHALVRAELVALQQKMAAAKGFILDGRDIGTVVLKDAEVKIFLTASSYARAKRRYLEYLAKDQATDFETILNDIEKRDLQDSTRVNSPLKQAEDAVVVDTSELTIPEVIYQIKEIIAKKLGE